jgi:hypothetical protein
MARGRGKLRNGRSKGKLGSFIAIERSWRKTEAYRALSPRSIALLLELMARYHGDETEAIIMGERQAAEFLGVARETASKALAELERTGFIVPIAKGHFDRKTREASTWRLTMLDFMVDGKPVRASYDFMRWSPQKNSRD